MTGYDQLTLRNAGYIGPDLQGRIRSTRILVAGCGLGSVVAETAARTGFERFILVDDDTVDGHNLNRQAYVDADVGTPKVRALSGRIRAINPAARVEARDCRIEGANAKDFVDRCDIVFDTIDFLDLPAIIALHDEARGRGLPVISAFSAGWGSVSGVFLPGGASLREICGLPVEGDVSAASYVEVFSGLLARLAPGLPSEFVGVSRKVAADLADGKPCPAPQLAGGAACTASLMVTQAVRLLAGLPVTVAPQFVVVDPAALAATPGVALEDNAE